MSTWRPTVIVCNHSDCKAQWVAVDGCKATDARERCALEGWTTGKGYTDWCPQHEQPKRRRKTIWRHGAHAMVQEALTSGVIEKAGACEECHSVTYVVGHHDDYAKPLDLRWLCEPCHQAWHREHGAGAHSFIEGDD